MNEQFLRGWTSGRRIARGLSSGRRIARGLPWGRRIARGLPWGRRIARGLPWGRRLAWGLIGLGVVLAAPAVSLAGDRGNLIGMVVDSLGKPVAGVEIQVLDVTGKPVATAVSTERGRYRIRCIEEGLYGVRLVPGDHDVRGRTATVKVPPDGRRLDWTVDEERPALPRAVGYGGKCNRTAIARADAVRSAGSTSVG